MGVYERCPRYQNYNHSLLFEPPPILFSPFSRHMAQTIRQFHGGKSHLSQQRYIDKSPHSKGGETEIEILPH